MDRETRKTKDLTKTAEFPRALIEFESCRCGVLNIRWRKDCKATGEGCFLFQRIPCRKSIGVPIAIRGSEYFSFSLPCFCFASGAAETMGRPPSLPPQSAFSPTSPPRPSLLLVACRQSKARHQRATESGHLTFGSPHITHHALRSPRFPMDPQSPHHTHRLDFSRRTLCVHRPPPP